MNQEKTRRLWPVAGMFAGCAMLVFEASAASAAADPLDASVVVPPAVHQSPLAGFRGSSADKPLSWREANDEVGRIGGWRAYAREANAPDPAPAAQPASAAAPDTGSGKKRIPDRPAGHHMK